MISREGGKQAIDFAKGKGKTMSSVRKIRSYDEDFDPRSFVDEAMDIYKAAHECLADNEHELLHKYATEKAYPEMMFMTKRKTIRWKFIKSLEPPKVVHARHAEIVSKENMFGQVTVRFHTQQVLAVYDRSEFETKCLYMTRPYLFLDPSGAQGVANGDVRPSVCLSQS